MTPKAGKQPAAMTAVNGKAGPTAKSTIKSKARTATKIKTVAHVRAPTRARSTRNITKKNYAAVMIDDEEMDNNDTESEGDSGKNSDVEEMNDIEEPPTAIMSPRTKIDGGAQTMSQINNPHVDGTFPLFKLPPELREKIFKLHLCPGSGPIFPLHIKSIRSFCQHKRRCLFAHSSRPKGKATIAKGGQYAGMKRWSRLLCSNQYAMEEQYHKAPESVLALLETCREVFAEAVHIFYRFNHLQFIDAYILHRFLQGCGDRLQYISDIGFRCTRDSVSVAMIALLQKSLYLKRITVIIRVDVRPWYDMAGPYGVISILKNTTSGRRLALLRGIETIHLGGNDYTWQVNGWQGVDVEHIFGPWLRMEVTKPRLEEQPLSPL